MKKTKVAVNKRAEGNLVVLNEVRKREGLVEMEKRLSVVNKSAEGNVVELRNSKIRKELLEGTEESISYIETEVYYELIEDLKEEAKKIYIYVIERDCIDARGELDELDSIMVDLRDYQIFYEEILDYDTKLDIEREIMKELTEELENCVIGYSDNEVIMIMCEDYYKTEIKGNEDNDYEGVEFHLINEEKVNLLSIEVPINRLGTKELKEKAKILFKDVASTHYIDISDNLSELDSIMLNLPEYIYFYNEILDVNDKLEIEGEIMEGLAEELKCNSDYVIGYDSSYPVMIMCMKYFIDGVKDYDYGDIEFYRNKIKIK